MSENHLFLKNDVVVSFSPLQVAEGLAEGLQELTGAELQAFINPPKTLRELASVAMTAVNTEYTKRMNAIAENYPVHERESWPVQLSEARDLQTDLNALTPWIDQCAAQRGMTREELATRILHKDAGYRQISGFLTGVRQKHEDEINALLDAGESSRDALANYWYLEYWE